MCFVSHPVYSLGIRDKFVEMIKKKEREKTASRSVLQMPAKALVFILVTA